MEDCVKTEMEANNSPDKWHLFSTPITVEEARKRHSEFLDEVAALREEYRIPNLVVFAGTVVRDENQWGQCVGNMVLGEPACLRDRIERHLKPSPDSLTALLGLTG